MRLPAQKARIKKELRQGCYKTMRRVYESINIPHPEFTRRVIIT